MASAPKFIDDKSPHCIPFILNHLKNHLAKNSGNSSTTPFIIGLNGIQGSGKTTLVNSLYTTLSHTHNLPTLVFSIDDFYLPRPALLNLSSQNPDNPLVQHRGEPGTHDVEFLKVCFEKLIRGEMVRIPVYDKFAFGGKGDRAPEERWKTVNAPGEPQIQVVIFEGWCVGFRPLSPSTISNMHSSPPPNTKTLQLHTLPNLLFINTKLEAYNAITDLFNVFIHIDAEDLGWVYEWREEQEEALRREKGVGMTGEEVRTFVDGYFPAYELFTGMLREGIFVRDVEGKGRQLRLVVGRDRKVRKVIEI